MGRSRVLRNTAAVVPDMDIELIVRAALGRSKGGDQAPIATHWTRAHEEKPTDPFSLPCRRVTRKIVDWWDARAADELEQRFAEIMNSFKVTDRFLDRAPRNTRAPGTIGVQGQNPFEGRENATKMTIVTSMIGRLQSESRFR